MTLKILREFGLGKNILAEKIQLEVMEFLKGLESENGTAFDPHCLIHRSIANIIFSVLFGKRYEHGDPSFLKCIVAVESSMRDAGRDAAILNFLPFLRFLPGDLFHLKRADKNGVVVDSFHKNIYNEHMKNYDENCVNDFISAYRREIKKKEALGKETTLNG